MRLLANGRSRFVLPIGLAWVLVAGTALGQSWDELFASPDPWAPEGAGSMEAAATTTGAGSAPGATESGAGSRGPTAGAPEVEGELPLGSAAATWLETSAGVMHLTADYLEYDRKHGRVVMKGGAYARDKEMQLWAEGVELEIGAGRVHAAGKVRFLRGPDDLTGDGLEYSYRLREGEMEDVVTWRGPNKVVARKIVIAPVKLVGHDVYTTACDHDPPHYRVKARTGTLYPGDKLILDKAALMVGDRRLFGIGRYKAGLRENSSTFFLRPGWSQAKGFTVDASYDFFFSGNQMGRALYQGTSEAGGSGGVAFRYGAGEPSGGDLRLFHSETRLRGQGALGSQFLDQAASSATLSHRHKLSSRGAINVNAAMTRNDIPRVGLNPLFEGVNEELTLNLQLSQTLPDFQLGLQVSRRLDRDGDAYLGDNQIPFLGLAPLFTFSKSTPFALGGGLQLRMDGSYGVYQERSTAGVSRDTNKGELNFQLTGPAAELGSTRLQWTLQEKLNWYSGGLDRDFMSLGVNSTTPLGKEFELSFNYTLQREHGESPFTTLDTLFDQQIATMFLRQRRGKRFHATWLELSRDLDAGQIRRGASSFFLHSRDGVRTPWGLGLTLNYDFPGEKELSDLELATVSTNFRFGRGDWRHQLITNLDHRTGQLASFSTGHDFKLDEKWRVQLATNYGRGGPGGDLERTRLAVALTRDLHAWEAKLRWDVEQKEVFLELYLKHQSRRKLGIRADYDLGVDLHPFMGEKLDRPGPTLADLPDP